MIDSHAHYDDRRFHEDRHPLLQSLAAHGVELVINIGADMPSSHASIALAERYPFVYAAVGVHPHDAKAMRDTDLDVLRQMAATHARVVAIGEIGLDYHYDHSPREIQRQRFAQQLCLAEELGLPVVVHSREACADTWEILSARPGVRGVVHCYSGSREQAEVYVKAGYYIGVGGVVTYKNARKLVESVEATPLSRILLETDCPYLSPEPFRRERNSSLYLNQVAQRVAQIKNVPVDEVESVTNANVYELFSKIHV